ncbi:MAG TPA: hypothetical protein ENF74_02470 [Firmicutes bacterium]|nr:hypothetical protein [Bacillota bacterium]
MSVRLYDKGEFARVAQTIQNVPELKAAFLSSKERLMATLYGTSEGKAIYCFVERLYIANRLAYEYQYGNNETITIPRMKETEFVAFPYTIKEFIEVLSSIRYNLYTNNDRCFLGQEDMERVDRLLNTARRLYIEQLEEELGRR